MKKSKPTPVHSYAILPDGTVLPIPGCRGFHKYPGGMIQVYDRHPSSQGASTLILLPAGSALVTNWKHPLHE